MLAYDLPKLEAGFKNHQYNCKLLMFLNRLHDTYLGNCTALQVKLSLCNYSKTMQPFLNLGGSVYTHRQTHLYGAGT